MYTPSRAWFIIPIPCTAEEVLKTALSLYMSEDGSPLPTPEELLICNERTSIEEVCVTHSSQYFTSFPYYIPIPFVTYIFRTLQVNLLWQRAVCDEPDFQRVFCLVHAEKLPYQTADKTLRSLNDIRQGKTCGA